MTNRRDIFTAQPPDGDYVLSPTGLTWGVRRMSGGGSAVCLSAGEHDRTKAVAMLLSLAKGDRADAWGPAGYQSFRLVKGYRPPS